MAKWKIKTQSGDKFQMINEKGEIREVKRDREGIKKGWYLQPHKDKDRFIETYGHHPSESKEDIRKYLKKRGLDKKQYANYEPNKKG